MANYVLLERIELNASAASVTFSNIPQSGYTDLKIVMSLRGSSSNTNYDPIGVQIAGSAPTQSYKSLYGTGSSALSYGTSSDTFTASTAGGTWARLDATGIQAGGTTANVFSNGELYIPNYTGTTTKSYSYDMTTEANATEAYAEMTAGSWTSSTGIAKIAFALRDGNFVQYSTFSLYGLAAVGTTPAIAPKASGGNITTDGTYWYHTFLASGTFTPATALTCDALVVAGGGGSSYFRSGGGGAGGLLTFTGQSLLNATTITVGAGGTGGLTDPNLGTQGGNSQLGGLTAAVGGGYGGNSSSSGIGGNGGSGGGAQGFNGTRSGGSGTSGQGNAGGSAVDTSPYPAGGGGGAGAVGANGTGSAAGNGGVGFYNSLTDAMGAATNTGQLSSSHYYYAGGGGGGLFSTGTTSTGGLGGGGAGSNSGNMATAGTVNTGGGGGGSGYGGYTYAPGVSGGSGIVIIRYTIA